MRRLGRVLGSYKGVWLWAYEKARPKHIQAGKKMGLTISPQQQKFFVLEK